MTNDETVDALPEGWREAYYSTESVDETYVLVTAVYEHVPSGVKTVICPKQSAPDIHDAGHTTHKRYFVYPLYEDIGIPRAYSSEQDNLDEVVRSVVPEVKPRSPDAPNRNPGPYKMNSWGEPSSASVGGPRAAEATFDWGNILPSEAIEQIQTFKQFPLDYSPVTEKIHLLHQADVIHRKEPQLLPDPYPLTLLVHRHQDTDKPFCQTEPHASHRFIEKIQTRFGLTESELDQYESGTELATLYVEFQNKTFPYDPEIVEIEPADGISHTFQSPSVLGRVVTKVKSVLW